MAIIKNPVLSGFNPDPSICKVNDDYYIATSTFEWFPGVQIHHSKDLVHWELITRPLNRVSQLDMLGVPDSGGVWAPCLTYHDGIYYLIYTIVLNTGHLKDTHNYLVTTDDLYGEWSEPIYLNSSGFDPSLFHDDDGKKWLVNMKWDTRIGKNCFAGILLQEYDKENKTLVGPVKNIFNGTVLGCTEGPHIYKLNGYYYLLTAEGGTGYEHAVTLARSKDIQGPYEVHPRNPILTSHGSAMHEVLQKSGHASLVQGNGDDWFMVHLCSRPLPNTNRCVLGRETAIQNVEWREDNWLYLMHDSKTPHWEIEIDDGYIAENHNEIVNNVEFINDFNDNELSIHLQTLRIPKEQILSLKQREGYLRLYGKESLFSKFTQSLVAHRQQSFAYSAETCVEFCPETSQHMAGLICYYNTENYYYLRISHDEELGGKCIGIIACVNNDLSQSMLQDDNITIEGVDRIYLKVEVEHSNLRFYYAIDEGDWISIGEKYDASTLSDDAIKGCWAFTGAFVGLCCQDLTGGNNFADFDYFHYIEA